MKIIDAHFHFASFQGFDELAVAAGHENTADNLRKSYANTGIVHGIVMSNVSLDPKDHHYPQFMSYCIGLDRFDTDNRSIEEQAALVEENLKRPECVGIKLYPGYNHFYVYEDRLRPFYDLAVKYDKPVAIHTGLTATERGLLKYSHPFTLDEAAVKYNKVRFVMCHIGNPFLADAIAVWKKIRMSQPIYQVYWKAEYLTLIGSYTKNTGIYVVFMIFFLTSVVMNDLCSVPIGL